MTSVYGYGISFMSKSRIIYFVTFVTKHAKTVTSHQEIGDDGHDAPDTSHADLEINDLFCLAKQKSRVSFIFKDRRFLKTLTKD